MDESDAVLKEIAGLGGKSKPKHKPKPAPTAPPIMSKIKYSTVDPKPHSSHDHYEKHMKEALQNLESGKSKLVFIGDSCLSQMTRDQSVRDLLIQYHPINLASPGFRTGIGSYVVVSRFFFLLFSHVYFPHDRAHAV